MNEGAALDWLDRLLDLDDAERAASLHTLMLDDPTLHARVLRLLAAAAVSTQSAELADPVLEGLRAAQFSAAFGLVTGQAVAGYRLLRELGRGGMAVVWLAERTDGAIKRDVAVKLPLFVLTSSADTARFEREKDVLATLTHPNIARLYDAGVTREGQPFIVLEFVDGVPVTAYCDQERLTLPKRLEIFLQIVAAVDHAHKHLVVHRDLKPSNILVDSSGQVKLLDFGIAKLLGDAAQDNAMQLTRHGNALFTPLYAAPEQVRGQFISVYSDVYVLGVVLHELLTGTLPHADPTGEIPSLAAVVERVLRAAQTHPSHAPLDDAAAHARSLRDAQELRSALRGDLDCIVAKAMQPEPAQRYQSAEHFGDDVRRFLGALPILARPHRWRYTAGLFLRRNRGAVAIAAIGATFFLGAAATAVKQYRDSLEHQARTVAIRDFMFDLVDDAEPSEANAGEPINSRQMIDNATARAHQDFANRPRLLGELLGELGHMYLRVGARDTAEPVLAEAVRLLEREAPSDDPSLNKARAQLALVRLDQNDVGSARSLARQARDACTQRNLECSKARAYGDSTLSRIYLNDGNSEQALASMRQSVVETVAGFGERHSETALALLGLAVQQRNAGQLQEASATLTRALSMTAVETLRTADRIELQRTAAVLDLDLGHYQSAAKQLRDLLEKTEDREERALQLRLLANVFLEQGEVTRALESATSALSLSDPEKPEAEKYFALQAHARALAMSGNFDQALAEGQSVIDGLTKLGRQPSSPAMLRAERIRGEILLRAGRAATALQSLESLSARLKSVPDGHGIELGLTSELQACAQRELGRSAEAAQLHRDARKYFQKQLPSDHPFLIRNTLYQELADDDRQRFTHDAATVERSLAATSVFRRLIDVQIDPAQCEAKGSATCVFVL